MQHRLTYALEPESIAIIGASDTPGRIGGRPIDLLNTFGFSGKIFPVNPKYEEIQGHRCFPDIESLPEAPDVAVLAIAAEQVVAMLRRCHEKGVKSAILYAAGFAEMGGEGAALQTELEEFAAASGMIVVGPNCMGFANLNSHAYTTFANVFNQVPMQQHPGTVGVVTQSGNVCSALYALLRERDLGVTHFINTGNEACVEFAEYLEFLAQDESTQCVLGYIEQLRDGERFSRAALAFAAHNKPLIMLKVGETAKGSEAVSSHTAAMAGDMAVYNAAFRQLNVIKAADFAQMADIAFLSGYRQRKAGNRVGIVTLSGALGAILADRLNLAGLEVPTLPAGLQDRLRAGIPDYGMVSNPIDVTGNIVNSTDFTEQLFTTLGNADELDVIVIYASGGLLDRMAEVLITVCGSSEKLFVVIDNANAQSRERLIANGIPVFSDIGRATAALGPYCHWATGREKSLAWAALRESSRHRENTLKLPEVITEYSIKSLLAANGVPVLPEAVAGDAAEARRIAAEIGFPVVAKILSPQIAHKTEVGGVILGLGSGEQVAAAANQILDSARRHAPAAEIHGILIQKMCKGTAELIVGITRDPAFGLMLTVGLGGELTELYRDVQHALLPVDAGTVEAMLRSLVAYPLLDGFRGRPKADLDAIVQGIVAVADVAYSLGVEVAELEVNPMLVLEQGAGAWALDALALPASMAVNAGAGGAA